MLSLRTSLAAVTAVALAAPALASGHAGHVHRDGTGTPLRTIFDRSAATAVAAAVNDGQYPDMRTLPPRDLQFDVTDTPNGAGRNVLRFTNTVWNAGDGPLRISGDVPAGTTSAPATQTVNHADGTTATYNVGTYLIHPEHQHFHYDGWGRYELWTKAAFDAWVNAGRPVGTEPDIIGSKTTSCVLDEEFIASLPKTPYPGPYGDAGCDPTRNGKIDSGLSVGWGDTYDFYRYEQWIDLGAAKLADGTYVLRSVADPDNKVYESTGKADATRESQQANEAMTTFVVSGGHVADSDRPTGTVTINDVAEKTSNTNVTVRVLGRDDASGVDQVRLSNDGVTWTPARAYGGSGSSPMSIAWDLSDSRYGGTTAQGTKLVYVQVRDGSGKWSATFTDEIQLGSGGDGGNGSNSLYKTSVLGDTPLAYWRLNESSGAVAADTAGTLAGTYKGSPVRAVTGLLNSDLDPATRFSGLGQSSVEIPSASALNLGTAFALEAWIKPESLPGPGQFASIVTRPESYSLQLNGPVLEFTIMQNGVRLRTQAPVDTIQAGQAYHVMATYDGAQTRLYVNAIQVATGSATGTPSANTNPLHIGSWDGAGEYFNGTIDEVAVYNTLQTGLQAKQHYDAGISTAVGVHTPTNLTATASASSTTAIDVAWTDASNNESGFEIQRSTTSDFASPTTLTAAANATSKADTGLAQGTTYFYRARAVTASDTSAWSNVASATTRSSSPAAPAAPTGLGATATSSTQINLAWTDASGDESGFEIQRSTSSAFTSPTTLTAAANATSLTDTGLTASTAYYYRARATKTGAPASAWSATVSATTLGTTPPPTAPAAPTGLGATATSSTQINLAWTDASGDESGFEIQRSTSSAFTSPTTLTAAANATSLTDTGLTASTAYYYRARATKTGAPASAWSATVSATTLGTTPAPQYAATVLADGPVSHWRLGERSGTTAADVRGANAGLFRNGPTLGAGSLLTADTANSAVRFDGTNDHVVVADSASLDLRSAITLEAWIKLDSVPASGSWASVVTKAEAFTLQFNGPRLEFTLMRDGVRYRAQAPSGAIAAGQTYHVVGTYDGTTQSLYVNGSRVATRSQTGSVTVGTWPLTIASWGGYGEYLKGTVDDVAVYAKALSAARVAAHYTAGRATTTTASGVSVARSAVSSTKGWVALGPSQRLTYKLRGPGAAARKRACAEAAKPGTTRSAARRKAAAKRACLALQRSGYRRSGAAR